MDSEDEIAKLERQMASLTISKDETVGIDDDDSLMWNDLLETVNQRIMQLERDDLPVHGKEKAAASAKGNAAASGKKKPAASAKEKPAASAKEEAAASAASAGPFSAFAP